MASNSTGSDSQAEPKLSLKDNLDNLDFGIMSVEDVYKLAREFLKGLLSKFNQKSL